MISFLEGKIILKRENFIILEVQGIGYQVFLSRNSLQRIPKEGENIKLFCYLDVGERSLRLYGFLSFAEREFFEVLRNVPGIGPKASLEIVSLKSISDLKKAIEIGDEKLFTGISGIGSKKAKKIILELSGKLSKFPQPKESFVEDESFATLVRLGFQKAKVKEALSQLPKDFGSQEERVKQALKILANFK